MESPKKGSRSRVVIYAAIGIGVFAVIATILFSGFSIGTLTETGSNPFGPGEPPQIVMINNGVRYDGALYGYTYSKTSESFLELPDINTAEITAISTNNTLSVDPGSQIQFALEGNPPSESQFDSLSVTAYTEDGIPVAVLDFVSSESTESSVYSYSYSLNKLQPGNQYILLSTATWVDPENTQAITGYVYYVHRISIEAQ
jgi:hypothetical protein